ncbi:hypothetical protein OG828_47925 [Streptomyces sp. NBC_00457]|uniref:SCO0607 family lipoprotein n=1 Tax=Streptomyces sp. NBC_00457 TaxID=2975748 RepID=UPI002E226163
MTSSASRPRPASRHLRLGAGALLGAVAVVALSGCSALSLQEAICSDGEYPVMTIGGTGSACVKDDEKVPEGYTRYPEGKVPQQVDDKWDVYWRTHTVDEKGGIVDASDTE